MKLAKKIYLRLKEIIQNNLILAVFVAIVLFAGFVVAFKFFTAKEETVYVKVKVSQGLWWASTAKPQYWMVNSLKKGDVETSLTGKPKGEILSVRSYPWRDTEQFNIYLTLKLQGEKNKRTGKYTYNRTVMAVGAPIDFDFSNTQVSGTIMEVSEKPFDENLTEKIVVLNKSLAEPWEYDTIQIGDKYSDGEEVVFEVIDKSVKMASEVYTRTNVEQILTTEKPVNIDVTAKMKFNSINGRLFFQEFPVQYGRRLDIRTDNYLYTEYYIKAIH